MKKDKQIYMVKKLLTNVEVIGYIVGAPIGFIPVYDDIKDAKKEAGKTYEILKLTAQKPENQDGNT